MPLQLLKLKDPITGQEHNIIFIIIDKFIKQGYFIIYTEEILTKDIVFTRYRVLIKIILDRNIRFIAVF